MAKTQDQRSAETRWSINAATIRSLVEEGYASTTTSSVCSRAGVSRGALTHHFASKQEMMISAVAHLSEVSERELSSSARRLVDDAGRTRAVIDLLWKSFSSDLFYASLELWNAARTDAALRDVLYTAERHLGARHRVLAKEMFGDDLAAHPDFERMIEILFRQLRGAAVTRILRREAADEDVVVDDLMLIVATMTDAISA